MANKTIFQSNTYYPLGTEGFINNIECAVEKAPNKDICAGCAANEDIFCNYNCTPKYRKDKLSVFFKPLSNGK